MSAPASGVLQTTPFASEASPESIDARLVRLEREVEAQRRSGTAIVVSGGNLDHVFSAMILATTTAALGDEARVFFSFWSIAALRKPNAATTRKLTFVERVLLFLLPKGTKHLALSRLHWGGAGTAMMLARMKQKGISSPEELFAMASEAGVKITVCEMTMDLMGLKMDDLVDYPGLELCGAATFLAVAQKSATTLFI